MANKRKKKSLYRAASWQATNPNGKFMMFFWEMYDSKAWKELTAKDKELYIHMFRKHDINKAGDSNENNISLVEKTYEDNIGYGELMRKETFWKCIDHLIELGFVKLVENRYDIRECNIYGFNDMWKHYGTEYFHIKPQWYRTKTQQIEAKNKTIEGTKTRPLKGLKLDPSNR